MLNNPLSLQALSVARFALVWFRSKKTSKETGSKEGCICAVLVLLCDHTRVYSTFTRYGDDPGKLIVVFSSQSTEFMEPNLSS